MSIVKPFPARLVEAAWAERVVIAMPETVDETERPVVPAEAYDDQPPAVYLYRQESRSGSHLGLVCDIAVEAFADGRVRGHEAVSTARVEALLDHLATTTRPPALVALLHHEGPAYRRALTEGAQGAPLLDFVDADGVRQTVWRLPAGDLLDDVTEEIGSTRLYIADGHHRAAAAIAGRERADRPSRESVLSVVHPMDGLRLAAFHRRIVGPVVPEQILELLEDAFDVRELAQSPEPGPGDFGLYVAGRWYHVHYREERAEGLAGFDATILHRRVLDRLVLPSGEPFQVVPSRILDSLDELVRLSDKDGGALFTLAPPELDAITQLADAGEVMPPKTTYFAPKPAVGLFVRP